MTTIYTHYITPSWVINTALTGRCNILSFSPANTQVILSNLEWKEI